MVEVLKAIDWKVVINQILPAVLVAVVTYVVVPILAKVGDYIAAKIANAKLDTQSKTIQIIGTVAGVVVQFVEQKYKEMSNEDKFDKAYQAVADVLVKKGINVTEKEIEQYIESSVKTLLEHASVNSKNE